MRSGSDANLIYLHAGVDIGYTNVTFNVKRPSDEMVITITGTASDVLPRPHARDA